MTETEFNVNFKKMFVAQRPYFHKMKIQTVKIQTLKKHNLHFVIFHVAIN